MGLLDNMKWLGYTTHELTGTIAILLFVLIIWRFRRMSKTLDDSYKSFVIVLIIAISFVLTTTYLFYLKENPNEIIRLF